jgi:hypothetical protein
MADMQSLLFEPPRFDRGQSVRVRINHTCEDANVVCINSMGVVVAPYRHPNTRIMIHYPWKIVGV